MAMGHVASRMASGAPSRMTPTVFQKPSTAIAQEMTPITVSTTLTAPSSTSTDAQVRSVL